MSDPSPPTILQRCLEYNRIETDLPEAEVQRIIEEANAEIVRRWGPHANPTNPITVRVPGGSNVLHMSRPIDATQDITIVETYRNTFAGGTTETTLASDDYMVWLGGRIVERLFTGTNPGFRFTHEYDGFCWGGLMGWADVTYTPVNDGHQREEVIIKLTKLTIDYETARDVKVGDVELQQVNYQAEREALLNSLRPPGVLFR